MQAAVAPGPGPFAAGPSGQGAAAQGPPVKQMLSFSLLAHGRLLLIGVLVMALLSILFWLVMKRLRKPSSAPQQPHVRPPMPEIRRGELPPAPVVPSNPAPPVVSGGAPAPVPPEPTEDLEGGDPTDVPIPTVAMEEFERLMQARADKLVAEGEEDVEVVVEELGEMGDKGEMGVKVPHSVRFSEQPASPATPRSRHASPPPPPSASPTPPAPTPSPTPAVPPSPPPSPTSPVELAESPTPKAAPDVEAAPSPTPTPSPTPKDEYVPVSPQPPSPKKKGRRKKKKA